MTTPFMIVIPTASARGAILTRICISPTVPDFDAILGRTLVLVAHPDDEAVGCGALLQRMSHPMVVFATDGGPRDPWFWQRYGSRQAYIEMREREARDALGIAGIHELHYLEPSGRRIVDQEVFRELAAAYDALRSTADQTRPEAVLTMGYEGGHPDHDACSVLGYRLGQEFGLPVWEFPLYHRSADGLVVRQEFLPREGEPIDETVIEPTEGELERRRRMLAAYVSQRDIVALFPAETERFRPQPNYDYSRPPHPGTVNYEAWQWPMRSHEVCAAFRNFLDRWILGSVA